MRALVFDGQSVKFRQYQTPPVPGPEDALIQIRMAGLCQTDLEIAKGYMGFKGILGHEFVGTVLKCRDAKWLGQRVVGEINCICGKCDMCQGGLSTHCRARTVIGILNHDGAFADQMILPMRNLHLVPENVPDEEAVFTEPLAAAAQILRQVAIDARSKVLVLGDGRLGQLVAQVIKPKGATLRLVGRHPSKLSVAERLGIPTAIDSALQPAHDQDVVIDCTGRSAGIQRALEYLRPRGTLVLKTTVAGENPVNLAPLVIDEITVVGSRCGPFRDALTLLGQKQVDVASLISRRMKIESAEELFNKPLPADTLKVLLTFDR